MMGYILTQKARVSSRIPYYTRALWVCFFTKKGGSKGARQKSV